MDRDGVINRAIVRDGKPYPPHNIDEVEILPGVYEALQKLRNAHYRLIVVTNQPDVARGTQTRETVEALHKKLKSQLKLDEFRVCYHDDADCCDCRKPKPGLLIEAAKANGIDLGASYMIGDRWRDIEAGQRAGCKTIFIDWGYGEIRPKNYSVSVNSLIDAVEWILR